MIENIIFDLGGVLYDIRYENIADKFATYGLKDFEKKYSQAFEAQEIAEYEKGNISSEKFRNYIRSLSEIQLTDQQIDDAWNAILIDVPERRVRLLQSLKTKFKIYLFSNTSQINYDYYSVYLNNKYGFDFFKTLFIKSYFSHEIHISKPDIKGFQLIIDEQHLNSKNTLFIDDTYSNVEGAIKAGMIGYYLKKGKDITDIDWSRLNVE